MIRMHLPMDSNPNVEFRLEQEPDGGDINVMARIKEPGKDDLDVCVAYFTQVGPDSKIELALTTLPAAATVFEADGYGNIKVD